MRGLLIGRFQPFHRGHLAAIRQSLDEVDELIVGIGSSQHGWTPENPFTAGERTEMILASLHPSVSSRVIFAQIPDVNDYSLWMDSVKMHSPRFDVIFTLSPTTRVLAREQGLDVRAFVPYDPKRVNGTRIRRLMSQKGSWRSLVPKGCVEVIDSIDGAARVGKLIENKLADIPPLEQLVIDALIARGATAALAESCTGGLASSRIVSVPGASKAFLGAIVAYSNEAKVRHLGVPEATISRYGAVSEQTARAMAVGVRRAFDSDIAVAITGVAGPDGASQGKPAGTVWLSLSTEHGTETRHIILKGNRPRIRLDASSEALRMLIEACDLKPSGGRRKGTAGTRRLSRASKSPRRD